MTTPPAPGSSPATEPPAPDTAPSWRSRLGGLELQEYALAIVVVLLFVVGAILKPDTFATWDNVRNMLTQASVVGVIAIGMTFVIATGGIDLSVGSVLAAAGVFGASSSTRTARPGCSCSARSASRPCSGP